MLGELQRYYATNGISAGESFSCKHEAECRGRSEDFTTAREAFVGREYERGTLPRLLFLSLDAGSSGAKDDRTLDGMRASEDRCDVTALPKNRHWYRTHELALKLLQGFPPYPTLETIHHYFAHTNSAKCCLNKAHKKQADSRLFDNCRGYIPAELAILKPDILVTQGAMAKAAVSSGIPPFRTVHTEVASGCDSRILEIEGRQVLWLQTYHPRNFGAFNRQRRECFQGWAELLAAFMATRGFPQVAPHEK